MTHTMLLMQLSDQNEKNYFVSNALLSTTMLKKFKIQKNYVTAKFFLRQCLLSFPIDPHNSEVPLCILR